jgi:L-alanine-DL-glutamate epimerase-like enolase superfamily enzyme
MQITKIKKLRLRGDEYLAVFMDTGERGLADYGGYSGALADRYLDEFSQQLAGQSAYAIESFTQRLADGTIGVRNAVLGCIVNALIDALGKKTKLPVYKLLGGRVRANIPLCAAGWDKTCASAKEYAAQAKAMADKGFRTVKFNPLNTENRENISLRRYLLDSALDNICAVQDAVGEGVNLCVDLGCSLDFDQSLWLIRNMEGMSIAHVQDPCLANDIEGLKKLSYLSNVPLAAGSRCVSELEINTLVESGAITVFQCHVAKVGGLYRARNLAALCEANYVRFGTLACGGVFDAYTASHLNVILPTMEYQDVDASVCGRLPIEGGCFAPDEAGSGICGYPDAAFEEVTVH